MTGNRNRVLIIAEAGVNHNGSLAIAKEMVKAAQWAGVDVVKFQTWKTENVVTKTAPKVAYQEKQNPDSLGQFEMLKALELPYADFSILKQYSDEIGIEFMSTADEYESAQYLAPLQKTIKIGSAELTDWPFLRKVASFGKPIILSTGMATLQEVAEAIQIIVDAGLSKDKITVVHCNSDYPTQYCDVNLRAMQTIAARLGVRVGYSDHTLGIEVPIAAVAMGACVVEKHFTLDRSMDGPDHTASLEPAELKMMVDCIRNIEQAMGDGIKRPSPSEGKNVLNIRKSIVARHPIQAGEVFTENNITVKRPGYGISPTQWDKVIGEVAARDFAADEYIVLD